MEYEFKEKIKETEKYIQNMRYTMIGKNGEIGIKEIKELDKYQTKVL